MRAESQNVRVCSLCNQLRIGMVYLNTAVIGCTVTDTFTLTLDDLGVCDSAELQLILNLNFYIVLVGIIQITHFHAKIQDVDMKMRVYGV